MTTIRPVLPPILTPLVSTISGVWEITTSSTCSGARTTLMHKSHLHTCTILLNYTGMKNKLTRLPHRASKGRVSAPPDPERSGGQMVGLDRPTLPGGADYVHSFSEINTNKQLSSNQSASAPLSIRGSELEHQIAGLPHLICCFGRYLSVIVNSCW